MPWVNITSGLYRAARTSADFRAMSKGPGAVGARIVRKFLIRSILRAFRL